MTSSTRRLVILVALAATLTVALAASTCDIEHCTACFFGKCARCEDGYYAKAGACAACPTDNCRKCAIAGRCSSCADGYELSYFTSSDDGKKVSRYGECKAKSAEPKCTNDEHCTSCLGGWCLYCAKGYYASQGRCAPCLAEHCEHCQLAGRCIKCEANYTLKYSTIDEAGDVNYHRWGVCEAAN